MCVVRAHSYNNQAYTEGGAREKRERDRDPNIKNQKIQDPRHSKRYMRRSSSRAAGAVAMPQWVQVSFRLKCVLLATSAVMVTSASGKAPTCTSHVGVPDFALQGKPPQKQRGLTFCQEHKHATCCDKDTTDNVRRVVYNMQSNQFSARCRDVSMTCALARINRHPQIPSQ